MYLFTDAIDCSSCNMSWLIRGNRHLLNNVQGGSCSNGTAFSALKSQAYAHCLSPISTTTSSTPKPSFTSSLTSSTVIFTCAKLVNVTGPCSRRRGMWAEEPIVVSFDDDVDRAVQILFTPVLRYCSKLLIHY